MRTRDAPRGPRATAARVGAAARGLGCARFEQRIDSTLRGAPARGARRAARGRGARPTRSSSPCPRSRTPAASAPAGASARRGRARGRRRPRAVRRRAAEVVAPDGAGRPRRAPAPCAASSSTARATTTCGGRRGGRRARGRRLGWSPRRPARWLQYHPSRRARRRLRARRARLEHGAQPPPARAPARRARGVVVTGDAPPRLGRGRRRVVQTVVVETIERFDARRRAPRPAARRPRRRRGRRAAGERARARAALPRRRRQRRPHGLAARRRARRRAARRGRRGRAAVPARYAWPAALVGPARRSPRAGWSGGRHARTPRGRPLEGDGWTAPRSR